MDDSRSARESPAPSDASSEPPEGYVIVLRGFPGSFPQNARGRLRGPDGARPHLRLLPDGSRHCAVTAVSPHRVRTVFKAVESSSDAGNNVTSTRLHALCPIDSTPFDETCLQVEPARLDRVQEELVFCLQANLGCKFVCKLKHLKHHYYYDCPFGPKTCDRCGNDQIPALQLLPHALHCRPRRRRILRRVR
ncbi:hypothetical protein MTO96_028982 [Rhipicephalus appendiculatus]